MLLALKLLLAPALVVLSSLAARRWGPRVGGVLVTIPIVAGPILLIIYLEHGGAFAAQAATASTAANVALAVFALTLIAVVDRLPWWATMLASWLAVLAVDLVLARIPMPAWVALILAVIALRIAQYVLNRQRVDVVPGTRMPWWDLPARAVATAVLVVALTGAAQALGPELSGVLAPFPIALSVVCAFAAAQSGRAGLIGLLRGIVPGLTGFALFCFVVAVTIDLLPGWASFTLATVVNVGYALVLLAIGRRPGS